MSKTDQAYAALRQDIVGGALHPDQSLTVSSLQARYGLGWTPLRDALSRLEGEGLVTLARNRGYRVAGVSHAELLDLQVTRLAIETELLLASMREGDSEWQKRALLAHRTLSRVPPLRRGMSEADFNAWEVAHQDFHLALLSGAPRIWLTRFAQQIHEQVRRHQRAIVLAQGLLPDPRADETLSAILYSTSSIEHHTILMDAALDRDEPRALGLLREHIGLPSDPDTRAGAGGGSTDGSIRNDTRARPRRPSPSITDPAP